MKKIIDMVILPQKKEISAQLFKPPQPTIKKQPPSRLPRKKYFLALLIIVVALAAIAVYGVFNSTLEVAVSPKKLKIPIAKTLGLAKNETANLLLFKTFETPYYINEKFSASESVSTEVKADGTIIVFNKAKDAQILIASTRFEAPNNKIYKIPKTIVVPAATTKDGKTSPGSKETNVFAASSGEDYNIGLTDFTLPGLKGSSKYDLVFARSKTEITGGASGKRIIVGRVDGEKAEANLLAKARDGLKEIASHKLPGEEFLLAPSLEYVVEKKDINPPIGSAANEFEVTFNGKVRGVFINRKNLEKYLVGGMPELALLGDSFFIANLDGLSFNIAGYNFNAQNFRLQISGAAEVEYAIDTAKMEDSIKTDKLDTASLILSAFPGLSRAEVRIRPFWLWLFGINPRRVDIILQGS